MQRRHGLRRKPQGAQILSWWCLEKAGAFASVGLHWSSELQLIKWMKLLRMCATSMVSYAASTPSHVRSNLGRLPIAISRTHRSRFVERACGSGSKSAGQALHDRTVSELAGSMERAETSELEDLEPLHMVSEDFRANKVLLLCSKLWGRFDQRCWSNRPQEAAGAK